MIYKDISSIIIDYVEDLRIHMKRLKVFEQINNIDKYEIVLCKYCREIKIKNELFNPHDICNHFFYLSKPIFLLNDRNSIDLSSKRILNHDVFNFYCIICNKYDLFFYHLNHN